MVCEAYIDYDNTPYPPIMCKVHRRNINVCIEEILHAVHSLIYDITPVAQGYNLQQVYDYFTDELKRILNNANYHEG
jgi:hypothetical protein